MTEEFPIYAVSAGIVRSIKDGNMLIEYDGGRFSRHFHLIRIPVAVGDRVAFGQLIGYGR